MIDSYVFEKYLHIVFRHFNRELQPEVLEIWKDYLDEHLTTEKFKDSIKIILLTYTFLPTAKHFVAEVKDLQKQRKEIDKEVEEILRVGRENPLPEKEWNVLRGKILQRINNIRDKIYPE